MFYHCVLIRCHHFLGHYLHALCMFNASISLLSNHLAYIYHVPSMIVVTDKVRSTLNKLSRASEPLLVIIPHRCPRSLFFVHETKLRGSLSSFFNFLSTFFKAYLFNFLNIHHLSMKQHCFFLFASLILKSSLKLLFFFLIFLVFLYKFSMTCCI
jgi:hypothetical protein